MRHRALLSPRVQRNFHFLPKDLPLESASPKGIISAARAVKTCVNVGQAVEDPLSVIDWLLLTGDSAHNPSMSVMAILRQLTVCFALWLVAITIRRDQRH